MTPLVSVRDLTISYTPGVYAVDHLSLDVYESEVLAIVGGSGSGKSTFLQCAIGLLSDGSAEISGALAYREEDVLSCGEERWNQLRGKEIAMIFQNTAASMNPNKKIRRQVWDYARVHSDMTREEAWSTMSRSMQNLRLREPERVLNSYPFQLSGGMQQRVAIAMSMLLHPSLILADEPTSALDVTVQAQVVSQIRELREKYGTAVIFVTHNMGVASYIADRIAVMEKGKLVELGTRDQVIESPETEYTKMLLAAVPELEE